MGRVEIPVLRGEGDRVLDEAVLEALHPPDLGRLLLDAQVAMDDRGEALQGHRDGQLMLADILHRRGHQGGLDPDVARDAAAQVHLPDAEIDGPGLQDVQVVEGQALAAKTLKELRRRKRERIA
jgi:hypothetical protein